MDRRPVSRYTCCCHLKWCAWTYCISSCWFYDLFGREAGDCYDGAVCHQPYAGGDLVWLHNLTEDGIKLAPHCKGPFWVLAYWMLVFTNVFIAFILLLFGNKAISLGGGGGEECKLPYWVSLWTKRSERIWVPLVNSYAVYMSRAFIVKGENGRSCLEKERVIKFAVLVWNTKSLCCCCYNSYKYRHKA